MNTDKLWHRALVVISMNDFVDGGGDLDRVAIDKEGIWYRVTTPDGRELKPPGPPKGRTWDEIWLELVGESRIKHGRNS